MSNGDYYLVLNGLANRMRNEAKDIDALLPWVDSRMPGSYGLLYDRSDEPGDPPGENVFRVRVLARGRIREGEDQWLSPINPTIED